MKIIYAVAVLFFTTAVTAAAAPPAESPPPTITDCIITPAAVPEGLTRAEKIALMEQHLMAAVNSAIACAQNSGGGGGGDGGGGGGNDGLAGEAGVAVDGIQGDAEETTEAAATAGDLPPEVLPNGKPPDDIPSAANDDIIAAQLRSAALAETDPEIRTRLWNEYRKYKGLPEK